MSIELAEAYTVRFRIKPDDLLAEHRNLLRARNRRDAIMRALFYLDFFAGTGSLIGLATGSPLRIALTIGTVLGGLAYWQSLRAAERHLIRDSTLAGYLDEQTVTITTAGFERAFEDGRKFFCPWKRTIKLGKTERFFILKMDDKNLSLLLPLDAFGSEVDAEIFMGIAEHWHSMAIRAKGREL